MYRKIIAVCGPTAVGKTKFAIEISKRFNGEIISCDSMQLYKYMDIGSAKPAKEELLQVKHYMVDEIEPSENFSVAQYQVLAKKAINDIFSKGKIPVIAGGTGLYLNSILYDMDFSTPPAEDAEYRKKLYEEAEKYGEYSIYEKLLKLDAKAAERIHPNNIKKVVRALEAAELGNGIKDFAADLRETSEYKSIKVCLNRNRDELYDRINLRVDMLMSEGLENEVKKLLSKGLSEENISMKGIGYKELISYFNGEYDKGEAIRLIKRNTRHLAKRQITWFKRYEDMKWFNISQYENDCACIEEITKWLETEIKK